MAAVRLFLEFETTSSRARRSLDRLRSVRADASRGLPPPSPPWYSLKCLPRRRFNAAADTFGSLSFGPWLVRSTLFLLCGFLLTSAFYLFAVEKSNHYGTLAVCVPATVVVSLTIAFSKRARCILLLALPHVCSGKGQIVFIAYVFIVATNGPMRNAISNFHVLVNSTVCLQHKVANLLPPFVAENLISKVDPDRPLEIGGVFQSGRARMNDTLKIFRSAFVSMETMFNDTLERVIREHGWLMDKQAVCRKLKTRLDYAIDGFSGRLFNSWRVVAFTPWLPTTVQHAAKAIVTLGFQSACGYDDAYDFFGMKKLLRNRMNAIGEYVKQETDLDVHFDHHYSFAVNQSKSFHRVTTAILADVLHTFGWVKTVLNIVSLTLGSTSIMVVIKAVLYRRKYGRSPNFDNYYLSGELVRLDRRRELMGLETVLPLRRRERFEYVTTFSLRLVPSERRKFVANLITLFVAAVNVACYVAFDYAIYWFAETLNVYGGITVSLQGSALPRVDVTGDGIPNSVFRGVSEAFDPFTGSYVPSVDLTPCLPNANPPDLRSYVRLGQSLLVSLLMIFVGTWLMRLRHVVAAIYDPSMKRSRAVWLHRKILIKRIHGLRELRRKIRKSFLRVPPRLASGVLEYFSLSRPWLGKLMRLFGYRPSFCLVCGERFGNNDHPVECDDIDCKGVYCSECYRQLGNVCPLCANPVDYGDEVDVSEECDSSDDDCVGRHASRLSSDDGESDDGSDDDAYGETKALVPNRAD